MAQERHGSAFDWVNAWIAARFGDSLTALKYGRSWSKIREYLMFKGISSLANVTRETCFEYFLWRTEVARNTAYGELRVLSVILREAVLRGILTANPAAQLGIKRHAPATIKPELSREVLNEILACCDKETRKHRDFYRISFLIARYQGCRLAETRFPLHWANLDTNTLTLHMKGGKRHTVPLHTELRSMFVAMQREGRAWTFTEPSDPHLMSVLWRKFFIRHGFAKRFPGCCFHALRVSVISQLARANVSEAKAMRFVAHSSSAVHAIYQRVRLDDLADCTRALA